MSTDENPFETKEKRRRSIEEKKILLDRSFGWTRAASSVIEDVFLWPVAAEAVVVD